MALNGPQLGIKDLLPQPVQSPEIVVSDISRGLPGVPKQSHRRCSLSKKCSLRVRRWFSQRPQMPSAGHRFRALRRLNLQIVRGWLAGLPAGWLRRQGRAGCRSGENSNSAAGRWHDDRRFERIQDRAGPLELSNVWQSRWTSRKISWTRSSASEASRRTREDTPQRAGHSAGKGWPALPCCPRRFE